MVEYLLREVGVHRVAFTSNSSLAPEFPLFWSTRKCSPTCSPNRLFTREERLDGGTGAFSNVSNDETCSKHVYFTGSHAEVCSFDFTCPTANAQIQISLKPYQTCA